MPARSGYVGWAGSWIRGARVRGKSTKQWLETGDEGQSSCEKLWVVLAVLLVVAVCQNTPSEIKSIANIQKNGVSDVQNIFGHLDR